MGQYLPDRGKAAQSATSRLPPVNATRANGGTRGENGGTCRIAAKRLPLTGGGNGHNARERDTAIGGTRTGFTRHLPDRGQVASLQLGTASAILRLIGCLGHVCVGRHLRDRGPFYPAPTPISCSGLSSAILVRGIELPQGGVLNRIKQLARSV